MSTTGVLESPRADRTGTVYAQLAIRHIHNDCPNVGRRWAGLRLTIRGGGGGGRPSSRASPATWKARPIFENGPSLRSGAWPERWAMVVRGTEHCVVLSPHPRLRTTSDSSSSGSQLPAPLRADPFDNGNLAFVLCLVCSGRTDKGRRGRLSTRRACFRLVGVHGWGLGQPWSRRSFCRLALLVS